MDIFIQHKGQRAGPFSISEIHTGLDEGRFIFSDLAWYEGAVSWLPLQELLEHFSKPYIPHPHLYRSCSKLAVASLMLGCLSLYCSMIGIPAIICGHLARKKINLSSGQLQGSALAMLGLVTGYVGSFILSAAFITAAAAPLVIRLISEANQEEAINNARHIGLGLSKFRADHGRFPDESTPPGIAYQTNTAEIRGNSANSRFRQLIRGNYTSTETIFYAKSQGTRKPDGFVSGDDAIAPSECGFAYIDHAHPADKIPRPLVMSPFLKASSKWDPKPFNGKAVILWSDYSVRSHPITHDGKVMIHCQDILDPIHPIWSGMPPTLLLSE